MADSAQKTYIITLDLSDGKMVFEALVELPFKFVYELIGKLNRQTNQNTPRAGRAKELHSHSLNLQEIGLMINALGQMPFNRVHKLVQNLNAQVRSQMKN